YLIAQNRVKRADNNMVREAMMMRLQTKCQKNAASPDALSNLLYSTDEFSRSFVTNVFEKSGNCINLKREIELKMDVFLFNLKTCLSPKEDFLANFIRNAFNGVFEYFCDNNGRKLSEFKGSKGLQCVFNVDSSSFSSCIKPTSTHSTDAGEVILKQEGFCNDVTHIRKCIKKEIISQCNQDQRFVEISKDLLRIINDKCAGCAIFANFFLIVALILFHMKEYLF
ncbi:hypothetical protein AMK59_2179, partial [Oryctes borbonicus]